ncbi:hypothetical protein ERJ75_001392400 [Trypanosoma vivax]|nr:hypothetical protein ERJ75_001392400 [Trypanosoma vivax]
MEHQATTLLCSKEERRDEQANARTNHAPQTRELGGGTTSVGWRGVNGEPLGYPTLRGHRSHVWCKDVSWHDAATGVAASEQTPLRLVWVCTAVGIVGNAWALAKERCTHYGEDGAKAGGTRQTGKRKRIKHDKERQKPKLDGCT